jgi:hypothetical protein
LRLRAVWPNAMAAPFGYVTNFFVVTNIVTNNL